MFEDFKKAIDQGTRKHKAHQARERRKRKGMKVKHVDPALRPQTKIKAPKKKNKVVKEIPYHN